ncbi:MAG: shikimate kinase, partial [Roseburia sp.]|nr:shikimate kinase [Roseburia sp.]
MTDGHPIFLIGFMGTGKSTLGRALMPLMPGWSFVDLDVAAEQRLGCSATEAFGRFGAETFRMAEAEALADIAKGGKVVVACGGGTPCHGRNMELMLETGTVVRLTAAMERLLRRLEEADGQRPLLAGL